MAPLSVFREYGWSPYAIKEAAVSTVSIRRLFDRAACLRGMLSGYSENWFAQAHAVCQAVRLLERNEISNQLNSLHSEVLRKTGRGSDGLESCNEIRASYLSQRISNRDRMRYLQHGPDYAVRMKFPRTPEIPRRQGNLVVLKEAGTERGVLYLQYTESIRPFVALFDIAALAQRYRLVVEPSTWGYQDESFLLLIENGFDVVIQAQDAVDYEYIRTLRSNLVPLRLGAGDWIDPENFAPRPEQPKKYDFVMVASWSPVKRHAVFFDALAAANLHEARIALIGYPWEGRTRFDIERLANRAGLKAVDIFERISRVEVAKIIAESRVGVMLTRREGANRGIYECLFCDVPIVVPAYNRGVNKDLVNEMTGSLATDAELSAVLGDVLRAAHTFRPREWAMRHTGYWRAWSVLDACLRELAQAKGESYERPIAMVRSAPAASFVNEGDADRLSREYDHLKRFLRFKASAARGSSSSRQFAAR